MMTVLRILALGAAVVTGALVVLGSHPAEFVVADLLVVVVLVAAAVVPSARWALLTMVAGFASSLGVFVVALGAAITSDEPTVPLAIGVAACTIALVLAGREVLDRDSLRTA